MKQSKLYFTPCTVVTGIGFRKSWRSFRGWLSGDPSRNPQKTEARKKAEARRRFSETGQKGHPGRPRKSKSDEGEEKDIDISEPPSQSPAPISNPSESQPLPKRRKLSRPGPEPHFTDDTVQKGPPWTTKEKQSRRRRRQVHRDYRPSVTIICIHIKYVRVSASSWRSQTISIYSGTPFHGWRGTLNSRYLRIAIWLHPTPTT